MNDQPKDSQQKPCTKEKVLASVINKTGSGKSDTTCLDQHKLLLLLGILRISFTSQRLAVQTAPLLILTGRLTFSSQKTVNAHKEKSGSTPAVAHPEEPY